MSLRHGTLLLMSTWLLGCSERPSNFGAGSDDGGGGGGGGNADASAQEDLAVSDSLSSLPDSSVSMEGGLVADGAPPGGCTVQGDRSFPLMEAPHVASTAGVTYNSNPPSSGPHCAQLANYGQYGGDQPLDRCYWLHNLEHGGIALLYNCPTDCPEILDGLQKVQMAAPADPDCSRPRILITPYPMLDSKVAAAAWGRSFKADCLDEAARAAMVKFISDHTGSKGIAPERTVCN